MRHLSFRLRLVRILHATLRYNVCSLALSHTRSLYISDKITVQGDTVVSGTSCSHLFHKTCAFEWLQKHDHCPYCRKEMMTPNEMLATANEILGESRVLEMRMWGPTEELRRNEFDSAAVNSTPTVEMTSVESS